MSDLSWVFIVGMVFGICLGIIAGILYARYFGENY